MKKVLFIIGLALCSCSTDSPTEDQSTEVPVSEDNGEYIIYIKDCSVEGSDIRTYYVTKDTYTPIKEGNDNGNIILCEIITFDTKAGYEITGGFYGYLGSAD